MKLQWCLTELRSILHRSGTVRTFRKVGIGGGRALCIIATASRRLISEVNAAARFLVRLFMIQHDCGHGFQTAHTAIANARAELDERLARWMRMAHDRICGNTLELTHDFLSTMVE